MYSARKYRLHMAVLISMLLLGSLATAHQHDITTRSSAYVPMVLTRPLLELAFTSDRAGVFTIYRVREDGVGMTQLLTDTYGFDPEYSPDGARIVFESQECNGCTTDLFVMNADGTGITQLTDTEMVQEDSPGWSPDGRRIVFLANDSDQSDIYVMNHDGTNIQQVTHTDYFEYDPHFVPGGAKIGFIRSMLGAVDLFVMNADGSHEVNVTRTATRNEWRAVWSPDGTRVAFEADFGYGPGSCRSCRGIYVMNADGSNAVQLTRLSPDEGEAQDPAWSPDGTRIAFDIGRLFYTGTDYYLYAELYIMDADGSNMTRVMEHENYSDDRAATWRPRDADTIASNSLGAFEIK